MTPHDYVTRIEGVLGNPFVNGEVNVQFRYDTLAEAWQQMARIRSFQRELRLVKKDVAFTINQIRSSYTGQRAEGGTGIGSAVAHYEEISRLIDDMMRQLDTAKVELQQWMAGQKYQFDNS